MIKKLLAGTALAVLPMAAMAADLPVRSSAPAPIFVAAAPSWAGFYVGMNAGILFDQHNKPNHCSMYDGAVYDTDYCTSSVETTWDSSSVNSGSTVGALVGLTAGYNMQSGRLVYGIEGDIAAAGGGKFDTQSEFMRGSAETRALGTLRARVGMTNGNTLFFLTAGAAFVNRKLTTSMTDYDCADYTGKCGSKTKWTVSPVVGAGIEHQLGGGWSAKVEGLYVFKKNHSITRYENGDTTNYGKRFSADMSSAIVRFGVNYRFGGSASAPVLARY